MLKQLFLTYNRPADSLLLQKTINRVYLAVLVIFLYFFMSVQYIFAEGSKEINSTGGYRAYLFSSTQGNSSYPFPTQGTMKVYVNAGETIYVGSSAQGIGSGTINLRSPDGKTYTSSNSTTTGLIRNLGQELAGPQPNAGGYTPFVQKVLAGQQGIWEIDFISPTGGMDTGNPPSVSSTANWTQPLGEYIAAFDVSVRDNANTKLITGRVFTNVFSGALGTFNVGFNGIFNIITKDGYRYTLNNNGQAGNGFTFFVNNKGFRNTDGTPSYKSINQTTSANVQDPRADDSPTDITQKIFFNTPAVDLPASAVTPEGVTTWLLTSPAEQVISGITFTGVEGTEGKAGTNPLGANFTFSATINGSYSIAIDVNQNGVFTDAIDRKITGFAVPGVNKVYWDGLDGSGNKVPGGTTANYAADITVSSKAGEVHFPFFDVERNTNGIKLTRTNGRYSPDDTLYWDDSQVTVVGTPSNPVQNLTGISSNINGHKWGTPTSDPDDDNDFGNNRGIDTWGFISSAPIINSVRFTLQEADLAIDSIATTAGCVGQSTVYSIVVKNNGPSDVTGAKIHLTFPDGIKVDSVSSSSTSGTSSSAGGVTSGNAYDAGIAITNGATRTFTVYGNILSSATGSLSLTASILRPADVTDPDATDPDALPPTDPTVECNASPSGTGCNNIKTNVIVLAATPNAGADQTVAINQIVTITATSGAGTWSQATSDPAVAVITNPSAESTTVTGLSSVGKYHFIYANINSCADTVLVTVEPAEMIIPNIFTPNNDGKNDVFEIKGLESYPGSQLMIFIRWGNQVYKADNYLNNWNGSDLAEGTYYYVLSRRESTGSTTLFKGWVFLKRSK